MPLAHCGLSGSRPGIRQASRVAYFPEHPSAASHLSAVSWMVRRVAGVAVHLRREGPDWRVRSAGLHKATFNVMSSNPRSPCKKTFEFDNANDKIDTIIAQMVIAGSKEYGLFLICLFRH